MQESSSKTVILQSVILSRGVMVKIFEPACVHAQAPLALQVAVDELFATTSAEGVSIRRSSSKTVKPAMHHEILSLLKCCSMEEALRQHYPSESVCDGSFLEHLEGLVNTHSILQNLRGNTDLPYFQECKKNMWLYSSQAPCGVHIFSPGYTSVRN